MPSVISFAAIACALLAVVAPITATGRTLDTAAIHARAAEVGDFELGAAAAGDLAKRATSSHRHSSRSNRGSSAHQSWRQVKAAAETYKQKYEEEVQMYDEEEEKYEQEVQKYQVATSSAKGSQCRSNSECAGKSTISFSTDICVSGKCTHTCQEGYRPTGSGTCVIGRKTCGGKACTGVTNGFNTCYVDSSGKHCNPGCDDNKGLELFSRNGQLTCVNTQSDPDNCGRPAHICQGSYNGVGKRICVSGQCGLDCEGHGTPVSVHGHLICRS